MTTIAATLPIDARSARGAPTPEEARLLAGLRARDESAFAALIDRHHRALLTAALANVATPQAAEEVVQETWLAVLRGIDRFEGRSALGTWIYSILLNQARRRGRQDGRSVHFSTLVMDEVGGDDPAVAADRFLPAGDRWAGHWASSLPGWGESPEERLLAHEAQDHIQAAIAALPQAQRAVMTLRDVRGLSAAEVCAALDISEGNQRVLLDRARAKVRRALAGYLDDV